LGGGGAGVVAPGLAMPFMPLISENRSWKQSEKSE
jgi:hypothetical protein